MEAISAIADSDLCTLAGFSSYQVPKVPMQACPIPHPVRALTTAADKVDTETSVAPRTSMKQWWVGG